VSGQIKHGWPVLLRQKEGEEPWYLYSFSVEKSPNRAPEVTRYGFDFGPDKALLFARRGMAVQIAAAINKTRQQERRHHPHPLAGQDDAYVPDHPEGAWVW
jgi:hypothetical protein